MKRLIVLVVALVGMLGGVAHATPRVTNCSPLTYGRPGSCHSLPVGQRPILGSALLCFRFDKHIVCVEFPRP